MSGNKMGNRGFLELFWGVFGVKMGTEGDEKLGKEFELKYAAASLQVLEEVLCDLGGTAETIKMATTYFDAAGGELSRRKWTLRVRQENEVSVVTLKTAGDGKTRGEWEYNAETVDGAAEKLVALGAPAELTALLAGGVKPVCGAEFTRRAVTLERDGAVLEVALDYGRLFRGDKELPLCEMEVELKQGDESAAVSLAEELAARFGLVEEPRSKFVRAVTIE